MLFKRGQELVKAQRKFSPGDFMSQSAQLVLEIDFYFMCKFRAPEKKYIVFFVACLFVFFSFMFCQFYFYCFVHFLYGNQNLYYIGTVCMIFIFSGVQDHYVKVDLFQAFQHELRLPHILHSSLQLCLIHIRSHWPIFKRQSETSALQERSQSGRHDS